MCKRMLLGVIKIYDTTRVIFFEEGRVIAVLEKTELAKTLFDITVYSEGKSGRLLCRIVDDTLVFVAHTNLHLVLTWVRQCKSFLHLPL